MTDLPDGLQPYKRTATFTEKTVPAGLLSEHSTKASVWGLIRVEEGQLLYTVTDLRRPITGTLLTPDGRPGLVEPTILHRVEPSGQVRFHVQFYHAESETSLPIIRS